MDSIIYYRFQLATRVLAKRFFSFFFFFLLALPLFCGPLPVWVHFHHRFIHKGSNIGQFHMLEFCLREGIGWMVAGIISVKTCLSFFFHFFFSLVGFRRLPVAIVLGVEKVRKRG